MKKNIEEVNFDTVSKRLMENLLFYTKIDGERLVSITVQRGTADPHTGMEVIVETIVQETGESRTYRSERSLQNITLKGEWDSFEVCLKREILESLEEQHPHIHCNRYGMEPEANFSTYIQYEEKWHCMDQRRDMPFVIRVDSTGAREREQLARAAEILKQTI